MIHGSITRCPFCQCRQRLMRLQLLDPRPGNTLLPTAAPMMAPMTIPPVAVITTQMGVGHETRLKIICVFPGKIQGDWKGMFDVAGSTEVSVHDHGIF